MKITLFLILTMLACNALAQTPRLVVPVGHTSVNSAVFSPDGKYVLTGSSDQTAKLWDLSGHEIQRFTGHDADVFAVAFSPDGNYVLTGSYDNTAKLWDLAGREIRTFSDHADFITSVAFSPDGKYVLTGSRDKTAKLWDLSGVVIRTFSGHSGVVGSVAFSPDGQLVLTGSHDKTAKLWDLQGQEIQTFKGHSNGITSAAFSPDGQLVLTGSYDNTAKLWDLQGRAIQTFKGHSNWVNSVAFSPGAGKYILTGSQDDTAKLWDLSGNVIRTFSGHSSFIASVTFSPDGKFVLTSSFDNTAQLWNVSGPAMQSFRGHCSSVTSLAFSPNGQHLLTGGYDNTAKVWDSSRGVIGTFNGHTESVTSVAFSPDGHLVLTGSYDNTAKLWDLQGRAIQTFKGHSNSVNSVAFSPDEKTVLTGSDDETAKLWNLSGAVITTFSGHKDVVYAAVFSPDGKSVLTGSLDKTAKLWYASGGLARTFSGHTDGVTSVAFSPDGKVVLTGSDDQTAKLWDLSGSVIKTFSGHTDAVNAVAFSPDGKYVSTGSSDATVKLWDLQGRQIQTFKGHFSWLNSVVFSPDGKYIFSGDEDQTTKIWDVKSGKELATLISIDATDWAVTTPSGLFDASPGAMNLMYYMQGLEIIGLEQLKKRYWEPGLLAQIMQNKPLRDVSAFGTLPLYPEIKANITGNQLHVQLTERSGGLGKLSLFANGKELSENINPAKKTTLDIDLAQFNASFLDTNTLALRAFIAGDGWLKSQDYELQYLPPATSKGSGNDDPVAPKPRIPGVPGLYAIVIGTSKYTNPKLTLRFPDQDAAAMAKALQVAGDRLFPNRVDIQLLSTADAGGPSDKKSIEAAFAAFKTKAKAGDILVVYFSGHGITYPPASEKGQFYYLTKDIPGEDLSDPEVRKNYAVSSEELIGWINGIPAQKQVLIFDACNSGSVARAFDPNAPKELSASQVRAYDEMKDRTGTFILAGAAGDKVSFEASQYGQGLLTYSLLQGMSGLALLDDKRVDVMKLFQYARTTVPELAQNIDKVQTPMLAFPKGSGASFSIGKVDAQAKMPPLKPVKPVFIKSVFLDATENEDVLELGQALANYFDQATAKSGEAPLIYVPVDKYESGYKISGTYLVSGDTVDLNGRLKKGSTLVGDFNVSGKKTALPALAEAIVEKVQEMLKK